MNAKKLKNIRSALRNAGVDLRDAQYRAFNHRTPVTLTASCGRGRYKQAKRAAA